MFGSGRYIVLRRYLSSGIEKVSILIQKIVSVCGSYCYWLRKFVRIMKIDYCFFKNYGIRYVGLKESRREIFLLRE